jgi:hypothetical protein
VKFAKYSPLPDENENAIPAAVNFVNFAYMQELEGARGEELRLLQKNKPIKLPLTAAEQAAKSSGNKKNTQKTDEPVGNKKEEEK